VLQVDPDPRPRVEPAAHRVDQHVRRLQVRGSLRVTRLPSCKTGERILFLLRTRDLDQRMLRYPPP
jgi:hypothetical protein